MDIFKKYHPQPVDIPLHEYQSDKAKIDKVAAQNGYTYKGVNNNRAVFSTKK